MPKRMTTADCLVSYLKANERAATAKPEAADRHRAMAETWLKRARAAAKTPADHSAIDAASGIRGAAGNNGGASGARAGSKTARIIGMLATGATMAELMAATGWQRSSVHGAFGNDVVRHGHRVVRDGDRYKLA